MGTPAELRYEYRVGYRNANNTAIFYSEASPTSGSVPFPAENPSDSYMGSVYAIITDSIQDYTVYITDVQVN